jgi:uncharacterized membrane protein YtjA (UPF0391 family)
MIRAAISFFIIALVAYFLGANGIAGLSIEVGKILLFVFLALSVISFLVVAVTGKNPRPLP